MNKQVSVLIGYASVCCLGGASVLFLLPSKEVSEDASSQQVEPSRQTADFSQLERALAEAEREAAFLREELELAMELQEDVGDAESIAELSDDVEGHELISDLDGLLEGGLRKEAEKQMEIELGILQRLIALDVNQAEQLRAAARSYWDHRGVPVPLRFNRFDSPLSAAIVTVLDSDQQALYEELMERNQTDWIESQSMAELAERQLERSYTEAEKDALFSNLVDKYAAESARR